MMVFTALPYSPWSEKARWALDHHQLEYKYDPFLPIVGEVELRLRMRKPTGRVTVPVLRDGETWITDSFEIAHHADRLGKSARLFPEHKLTEVSEWNQRSEAALAAGRARMILAMVDDPKSALVFLPPATPGVLKPLLLPLARKGLQSFIKKYKMREQADAHESVFHRELERLESTLADRKYLIGDSLSYADITMALVIQGISPVDTRYMERLPGSSSSSAPAALTDLQRRYAGLITWRDNLYAQHRRPQKPTT